MAPGSVVPVKVGWVSLVVVPLTMAPVTGATSSVTAKVGAAGAAASSVKLLALLAGLVLPATSVTVALTLQAPSAYLPPVLSVSAGTVTVAVLAATSSGVTV